MTIDEKIYDSICPVHYVFQKSTSDNDYLIVVFSGFDDNLERRYAYNYMRTLSAVNCNKLFILDNQGPYGSYYIGKVESRDFERSVISLILYIIDHLGITKKKTLFAGSSKGGSAAIYFGVRMQVAAVIAGAFQTDIYDYIEELRPETLEYMLGTEPEKQTVTELRQFVQTAFEEYLSTDLCLRSSTNDNQYPNHILPFLAFLDENGIEYKYRDFPEMKNHSDVGNVFPAFLYEHILRVCFGIQLTVQQFSINGQLSITCSAVLEHIAEPRACNNLRLLATNGVDNETIEMKKGIPLVFAPKNPGFYDCAIGIFHGDTLIFRQSQGEHFIGAGVLAFDSINIEIKGTTLYACIQANGNGLEFAYYIHKNGKIYDRLFYTENNTLEFPLTETGFYSLQFFIKTRDGYKVSARTSALSFSVNPQTQSELALVG